MELSAPTVAALRAAAAGAEDLRAFCEFAAAALTLTDERAPGGGGAAEGKGAGAAAGRLAERIEGGDLAAQRLAGSVAAVYAEAARVGAHVDELGFFLTADCDLEAERARAVAEVYGGHREALQRVMARHTADGALPELVGVSWKLSYTASSGAGDRYFEPTYSVTFRLRRPAHLALGAVSLMPRAGLASWAGDEVSFLCSYEDMNSLVEQLDRACVSAELVASSRGP